MSRFLFSLVASVLAYVALTQPGLAQSQQQASGTKAPAILSLVMSLHNLPPGACLAGDPKSGATQAYSSGGRMCQVGYMMECVNGKWSQADTLFAGPHPECTNRPGHQNQSVE